MTDLLWMPAVDGATATPDANPNYVTAFEARVLKAKAGDAPWLLLDRTAFYAEGGGQPSDVGRLTWDGGEARVTHVSKKGAVKHVVDGDVPAAGAHVEGQIDWDLRYAHMRNHTAQHLVSALAWQRFGAATVGNQVGPDGSRIDLSHRFTPEDLRAVEDAVNAILARDLPVRIYEEERDVVEARTGERALLARLPQSVRRLRVVEVVDPDANAPVDYCPCAGTHVMRTGEIGRLEVTGRESKGGDRDRVTFTLKA